MGRHPDKIICLETGAIFNSVAEVARLLGCDVYTVSKLMSRKMAAQDNRTYIKLSKLEFIDKDQYIEDARKAKFKINHPGVWYRCDQTGQVYCSLLAISRYFGWRPNGVNSSIRQGKSVKGYTFTQIINKDNIEDYNSVLV